MALAKLYRVTDCDGQGWFVAATSFSEAERKFIEWETENDPEATTTELIDGIVLAGDLILGGNRDESIGNYTEIPMVPRHPISFRSTWEDSNQMAVTGTALVVELLAFLEHALLPSDVIAKMEALKAAINKYEEIPF
jgi:hypothetical protein